MPQSIFGFRETDSSASLLPGIHQRGMNLAAVPAPQPPSKALNQKGHPLCLGPQEKEDVGPRTGAESSPDLSAHHQLAMTSERRPAYQSAFSSR